MKNFFIILWITVMWGAWYITHDALFTFEPPFWVQAGVLFLIALYIITIYDQFETIDQMLEREEDDEEDGK